MQIFEICFLIAAESICFFSIKTLKYKGIKVSFAASRGNTDFFQENFFMAVTGEIKKTTVEFSDFREYQPGDDIRRIDWNLYSRFEKYFLKLFTDERQMQVQIFIDCSASMGKDNPKKAAYVVVAVKMRFSAR